MWDHKIDDLELVVII